jgi:hypothetical protein
MTHLLEITATMLAQRRMIGKEPFWLASSKTQWRPSVRVTAAFFSLVATSRSRHSSLQ